MSDILKGGEILNVTEDMIEAAKLFDTLASLVLSGGSRRGLVSRSPFRAREWVDVTTGVNDAVHPASPPKDFDYKVTYNYLRADDWEIEKLDRDHNGMVRRTREWYGGTCGNEMEPMADDTVSYPTAAEVERFFAPILRGEGLVDENGLITV